MGGSAIAADILAAYTDALPIHAQRGYGLPAWVGPEDLVIASSYSGDTEETLSGYHEAKRRGSAILAITTGGQLQKLCQQDGMPCLAIPGGMPPRCALGYSFFTLFEALRRMKVVAGEDSEVDEAISLMERLSAECSLDNAGQSNLARQLAGRMLGNLVVLYASVDHLAPVARRWACQINENAKSLAYTATLPELCHNEVVGWELPADHKKQTLVVMLADRGDHPRNRIRAKAVAGLVGPKAAGLAEVPSQGQGLLARLFSLLYLGDWASYHLACLNQVDPTPIPSIVELKKMLSEQ
jgi:glucose/mannose-6-phosphate isomerase